MKVIHAKHLYIGTASEMGSTTPPAEALGATFFQTDTGAMYYWDGDSWEGFGGSGTDANAVHVNVDDEIIGIAEKTALVSADLFVIEDSEESYAKKKVQVTNLPGGVDTTAIHKATDAEISAIAEKTVPIGADMLLIEDSAASDAKKMIQITNLPGGTADTDAIHVDEANEITGIAEKTSPVADDELVIEDSDAAYVKKSVKLSNLPGGVDSTAIHKATANEITAITLKGSPVSADEILIEDSDAAYVKKSITIGSLPGGGTAGIPMALTFEYDSSSTTDADPGAGKFKLNHATPASATYIYVDDLTVGGVDVEWILQNIPYGQRILIQQTDAEGRANLYSVSGGSTNASGYTKIPVAHVAEGTTGAIVTGKDCGWILPSHVDVFAIKSTSSAQISALTLKATPIAADHVMIEDSASGNVKKRTTVSALTGGGGGSSPTHPVWEFDDSIITDTDPGAGKFGMDTDKHDYFLATFIVVSDNDRNICDVSSALQLLASGDKLLLFDLADPSVEVILTVGTVTNNTGYTKIAITYVAASSGGGTPADTEEFGFCPWWA